MENVGAQTPPCGCGGWEKGVMLAWIGGGGLTGKSTLCRMVPGAPPSAASAKRDPNQ